ncbi:MAG: hypothetical protein NC313_05420 [Butyrivibrio sp.]|nr:hypothetical protein [Butyrivibrio sp.]
MEKKDMQNANENPGNVDWNDGKVHSVTQKYKIDDKENWHKNAAYDIMPNRGANNEIRDNLYVKGTQTGVHYTTNDPKKTIPVFIVVCVLFVVIGLIIMRFNATFGIVFLVLSLTWVISSIIRSIQKRKESPKSDE